MKSFQRFFSLSVASLMCAGLANAQVTSLTINGSSSNVSFVSGATVTWEIHLPPGDSSHNAIWLDVNQNSQVDPITDKLLFEFPQVDGAVQVKDGPSDLDNTANGVITTTIPLGFAPAKWIFVAKNHGVGIALPFTVTALQNPVATISGSVSGSNESPKQFIVFEAKSDSGNSDNKPFWHGITDANGNYSIAVGGDALLGSSWRVHFAGENESGNIGGYLLTPRNVVFTLAASVTNINFSLQLGTVITGRVTSGAAGLPNMNPHTHDALNPFGNNQQGFYANTDANGFYSLTVLPGKYFMHFTGYHYFDKWWNNKDGQNADTIVVISQDSIKNVDASLILAGVIQGNVTNWGLPVNATVTLYNGSNQQITTATSKSSEGYNFNVQPGTYRVSASFDGNVQYYGNGGSFPGADIVVSGTEVKDHIDITYQIGFPPNPEIPNIQKVWDVPNDQGKKVFVRWTFHEPNILGGDVPLIVDKYSIWRLEAGDETFVAEVPSTHDTLYTAIVPTLFDSTKTGGMRLSYFKVYAHFVLNIFVVGSLPDSGYSLDNLAPVPPGNPGGTISGGDFVLRWAPPVDSDVDHFAIYRGTSADFSIDGVSPIGTARSLSYTDVGAAGASEYFYKIAAFDFSGNRSNASLPVSNKTTGVNTGEPVPTEFALLQNYPNPFNPSTTIAYNLAKSAFVSVKVYNALGQEVATLVESEHPVGRYTVKFEAANLASGLYIYKIVAGDFVAVKKMSLIK